MQSMLQRTVFSNNMPRYGSRGVGPANISGLDSVISPLGRARGDIVPPGFCETFPAVANPRRLATVFTCDFGTRIKSPQRVQDRIGNLPFANSSRKRLATGPKKTSSKEFLFRSPMWPDPL